MASDEMKTCAHMLLTACVTDRGCNPLAKYNVKKTKVLRHVYAEFVTHAGLRVVMRQAFPELEKVDKGTTSTVDILISHAGAARFSTENLGSGDKKKFMYVTKAKGYYRSRRGT